MQISNEMQKALNDQIGEELYSQYIYLSMSAWFEDQNLKGFANWMRMQAAEEFVHGMKIYTFIIDRGGRAEIPGVEKPPKDWDSPLAVFEAAYKHECHITKKIEDLMNLANKEKDHASASMLNWFIDEQVEEEGSTDEIVQQLKMLEGSKQGIFILDSKVAQSRGGNE